MAHNENENNTYCRSHKWQNSKRNKKYKGEYDLNLYTSGQHIQLGRCGIEKIRRLSGKKEIRKKNMPSMFQEIVRLNFLSTRKKKRGENH